MGTGLDEAGRDEAAVQKFRSAMQAYAMQQVKIRVVSACSMQLAAAHAALVLPTYINLLCSIHICMLYVCVTWNLPRSSI